MQVALRPCRIFAAALIASAVLVVGCGGEGGSGAPELGSYDADPSLRPEEVAREYVEALDERDGERFCALVAPYIAGRYDLIGKDPDLATGLNGCPEVVSAYIGYVEDCCPDAFKGAAVERVLEVEEHGRLRGVRLSIRLRVDRMRTPQGLRTTTLKDVVWLARFDGAWRVAKLSEVARAASLAPVRSSADPVLAGDDDPAAMPDIAAEERVFAAAVERFRGVVSTHESSYSALQPARECKGGASLPDTPGDQFWNGAATQSGEPPDVPGGDLVLANVSIEGDSVCVRWLHAGVPEGPLALSYIHRTGPTHGTFFQSFDTHVRADGTARVTSGRDGNGRPIPVPARVGRSDAAVSVLLTPAAFREGQREWRFPKRPPLDRFGFSIGTVASAGGGKSVVDQLGVDPSSTFRYPDGGLCPFEGC